MFKSKQHSAPKVQKTAKHSIHTKALKKSLKPQKKRHVFSPLAAMTAFSTPLSTPNSTQKRKIARKASNDTEKPAEIEPETEDFEEEENFWKDWSSDEKKEYNQWMFKKLSPVFRRAFYTALAVQGFQPAEEKIPADDKMTQHMIETLAAHSLIIPADSKIKVPSPTDEVNNPHQDAVDDLWFILDSFEIIPRAQLKKFKKGYINPNIEFREFEFETDAFNKEHEVVLTPEQLEEDGDLYTVRDAIETCLKMIGVYDVQYFQDDETDADLSLPLKPESESKLTSFANNTIKMYPFHEDVNAPLTRMADEFERDYLASTDDIVQLHDLHNQFYRHDVVSTLHPEVAEIYDKIINATDECTVETADGNDEELDVQKFSQLVGADDLMVLRGVIRDFYLQTICYEDYLSNDQSTEYYHVNIDFDEQLYNTWQEQGEYDSEADDAADEEFLKSDAEGPHSSYSQTDLSSNRGRTTEAEVVHETPRKR